MFQDNGMGEEFVSKQLADRCDSFLSLCKVQIKERMSNYYYQAINAWSFRH